MTTNNPLLTVQRMFEAFAKLTWIACLRLFIPIRAGPMLVRIRGQQNGSTSAGEMLENSSAKSFRI
jgi:hypothetical protein